MVPMEIFNARPDDYQKIRSFYHSLIDSFQHTAYHPGWKKDIYPDPDELLKEIWNGCLYYGREGEEIVSAMVLNHNFQDDAYAKANWKISASHDEVLVIHMLGVRAENQRTGLAGEMVRFAIDLAETTGMKAIRLDVLKGNLPAEMLYQTLGFSYINTLPMFYADVGWMEFLLFELPITPPLPLRPHHGMCFQFYRGKGYSEEFTDHMGRIVRFLSEHPQAKIRLLSQTDCVCEHCPNNNAGLCAGPDKVSRYDAEVLKKCCLTSGDILPYSRFSDLIKKNILDKKSRSEICGDCVWNALCESIGTP